MYIGAVIDRETGEMTVQFDGALLFLPMDGDGGWKTEPLEVVIGMVYLAVRLDRREHGEPEPTKEQAAVLREAIMEAIDGAIWS